MDHKRINRREFLKKTGRIILVGTTVIGVESLTGCATFPKASIYDIDKLRWDCNPILPIPKNGGIYIGTNQHGCPGGGYGPWKSNDDITAEFEEKYGKWPTIIAPGVGKSGAIDRYFPKDYVASAHRMGAIPMIRYVVTPGGGAAWDKVSPLQGYKLINQGVMDEDIRLFGAEAAKLEKPIIVCPFQQPNGYNNNYRRYGGPGTSGAFKETYVRIHDIWKEEGALEKVVMGIKLKTGRWLDWQYPDPLGYIPPKDTVDIIGWCVNNHCQPHRHTPSKSFEGILKTDYGRVVDKYREIPQFIWELACHEPCEQSAWMNDALTKIEEKYHWIKAVNLDECPDGYGNFRVDPRTNEDTRKLIREHFAKPRYIGNIFPVQGPLKN